MFLVLVSMAGVLSGATRPPSAPQPAMAGAAIGRGRRTLTMTDSHFAMATPAGDDNNIVMETLRVLGVVRHRVDRPIVGRKAYVRWWERLRALVVLAAIVIVLGIALAAVVGITVLSLGFLLERAIS